jgi:hypothetical protein
VTNYTTRQVQKRLIAEKMAEKLAVQISEGLDGSSITLLCGRRLPDDVKITLKSNWDRGDLVRFSVRCPTNAWYYTDWMDFVPVFRQLGFTVYEESVPKSFSSEKFFAHEDGPLCTAGYVMKNYGSADIVVSKKALLELLEITEEEFSKIQ